MKQIKYLIFIMILLSLNFVFAFSSNTLGDIPRTFSPADQYSFTGNVGTPNNSNDGDYNTYSEMNDLTKGIIYKNYTYLSYGYRPYPSVLQFKFQRIDNSVFVISCWNHIYHGWDAIYNVAENPDIDVGTLTENASLSSQCVTNNVIMIKIEDKTTGMKVNYYEDSLIDTSGIGTQQFSNQNLTFTGSQNITRYLTVPQGTILTNAFLNLTGINSSKICY